MGGGGKVNNYIMMTNEQYYWFVRRQNMIRAYAAHMTNLNAHANGVAGHSDSSNSIVTDVSTVEDFEKAIADETITAIKLDAAMDLPSGDKGVLV